MHRIRSFVALMVIVAGASTGCHSHEARVADLQKQYDALGAQFRKDCSGEMLDLPQKLSSKCDAEDKQVTDAWNRLQAERAKK